VSAISQEQLARLLSEHGPALAFFAQQWSDSPDDVVQDAFIGLLRQETLPERPVAWLYGTVRRVALHDARTERRRRARERRVAVAKRAWIAPADALESDVAQLMDQLDDLPRQQREVVVARVWGDLTFEEIGELTGASSSTAHRRYCQALESLRKGLNGRCEPNGNER
jgi:RNA polymerase sigma-70 factor (ECF subfamily)